jgi:acyl-CoA synthetase (AMP-forming)/AMP-acid ligase II
MLRDILFALKSTQVLWIEGHQKITVAEAIERALRPTAAALHAANVAVMMRPSVNLFIAMVALDGISRNILLLPQDTARSMACEILKEFHVDSILMVDDRNDVAKELNVPVLSSVCEQGAAGANAQAYLNTRWIMPTSGTTGRPKLVSHSFRSLTRSINTGSAQAQLRWGLVYDFARFAGLQVFLNALLNGSSLILTDENLHLDDRIRFLCGHQCTALSATPSMWRKILMTPSSPSLPLAQITLGGEIADQKLLDALHSRFPKARITHIYASTEAGVCFSIKDGRAGFPASYLEHFPSAAELRLGEDNSLWIRPSVREQDYFSPNSQFFDEAGYINSGDIVERSGNRYYFVGRANGSINVGGRKVLPEEVESALLALPFVRQASVYAKANFFLGSVVAADVVLDSETINVNAYKEKIYQGLANMLAEHKLPVHLNIVRDIRLAPSGKLSRRPQ